MDRLEGFDDLAHDAPLITRLSALGKLSLMHIESLEKHSSVIGPERSVGSISLNTYPFEKAKWKPLDDVGLELQRSAWSYYDRFSDLGNFVLGIDVPSRREHFSALGSLIWHVVLQDNTNPVGSGASRTDFEEARQALPEQWKLLEQVAGRSVGTSILVPDTNVLMDLVLSRTEGEYASALHWEELRSSHEAIHVVIVPPVVKELDELKRSRDDRRRAMARTALSALWDAKALTPRP